MSNQPDKFDYNIFPITVIITMGGTNNECPNKRGW